MFQHFPIIIRRVYEKPSHTFLRFNFDLNIFTNVNKKKILKVKHFKFINIGLQQSRYFGNYVIES